ncbi:class I SAM-dependent methyltransferase [Streptomyces sp. NPDC058401]|uniref:class I SAM-dependent methyltransferase n=1 Tax=Streptomyces sp. NPDC058401 TaxID=3346480 RepID=UPI0036535B67
MSRTADEQGRTPVRPAPTARDWHEHYAAGRDFRPLSGTEEAVLHEHLALPEGSGGARALEVACGTGQLARLLAGLGYRVDAVDFAEAALDRAAATPTAGITYHCLDVTAGELTALAARTGGPYDLITIRRTLAHLPDRARTVAELAALLAPGGTLCVITPHAARQPDGLRGISLDEGEISRLAEGWEHTIRREAGGSTVLLLRGRKAAGGPGRDGGDGADAK